MQIKRNQYVPWCQERKRPPPQGGESLRLAGTGLKDGLVRRQVTGDRGREMRTSSAPVSVALRTTSTSRMR